MKTLKDVLENKKVVFFGDSLTHNYDMYDHNLVPTHPEDPTFFSLGQNHVKMLNDVCHFKSISNFAVSGGCYANTYSIAPAREVFRHFPTQVTFNQEKIKEAEVIFVMMGTNDYSEQVSFGKFDEYPTSYDQKDMTFYQGMNYGFDLIKKLNPNALIIVLNCMHRTVPIETTTRMYQYSIDEYNLAIRHVCELKDLFFIDISNLFKIPEDYEGEGNCFKDGLHLNTKGYERLTDYILNYEYEK